ncbi:MAG: tyrosine protein phosphatase [Deltaproteobacteria bacterium]|nr:tyrosine protein phosphatase [Deltaproteobacteria bacterium]MBM4350231.1 tyrosine protein phosphatase [Deltaproteobacteria bacterium]
MGEMTEMIDLHCHILPGLDDGAKDLEESLGMCRIAYQDGIRTIVATPHTLNGVYENGKSAILTRVEELCSELKLDSAMRNPQSEIDLTILPGSDVRLSEDLLNQLEEGKVTTVGDGGKFLFVEFPSQEIPYGTEEILFQLRGRGIIPIITHPERNLEISQRPQQYYEMIRKGCLGQVTAMSLTGEFGSKVRQVTEKLLRHRLFHFIASDAHSINGRLPILSAAVKSAAKILGEEEAQKMVTEYPGAVLEDRRPNIPDPLPI